jgi:hypothetical protein
LQRLPRTDLLGISICICIGGRDSGIGIEIEMIELGRKKQSRTDRVISDAGRLCGFIPT